VRFLLDTNICIYLARRQPPQVVSRLEALYVTNNESDFSVYPGLSVENWAT